MAAQSVFVARQLMYVNGFAGRVAPQRAVLSAKASTCSSYKTPEVGVERIISRVYAGPVA